MTKRLREERAERQGRVGVLFRFEICSVSFLFSRDEERGMVFLGEGRRGLVSLRGLGSNTESSPFSGDYTS